MLRLSLGIKLLQNGQARESIEHFESALEQNPDYSAAHKMLAKALAQASETKLAIAAYEAGIDAAQRTGDKQAEKEMQVILKRLRKDQ